MKSFLQRAKHSLQFVLGALFGVFAFLLPSENQLFTHLRHDGKSLSRNTMPGDLLTGLSGVKEHDEASIAEAGRKLKERFDAIEVSLGKKVAKLESDFNQKLAASSQRSSGGESGLKEQIATLEREVLRDFMRTGTVLPAKASELQKLTGSKDTTPFLIGDNTFAVPTFVDGQILQLIKANSTLLSKVHTVEAAVGYERIMMRAGASGRASETSERTLQNAPEAWNVPYTGGELYARFQVSQWALDDAGFNVEQEFLASVAEEFASEIEHEVVAGGGTTEFTGLNAITDSLTPEFGELRRVVPAGAEVITYDDLVKTIFSTPKRYRQGAIWVMKSGSLGTLLSLKDDYASPIFAPPVNALDSGRLLGYPIEESDEIGEGRFTYFGNLLRGYSVHFVGGSKLIRDPYTRKGFVEFFITRRVRGAMADSFGLSVLLAPEEPLS
jgi:HK97 family phage major capsid protein